MVDKRGASVKRYRMSDGSIEAELFSGPVHFRDKDGKWQNVDPRPEQSRHPDWSLESTKNVFATRFGKTTDKLVKFELGGRSLTMGTADNGRAVTPSVDGDVVTFGDVFGTADVRYRVGSDSLKEEIVLESAPPSASYTFRVRMGGVRAQTEDDGSIAFYATDDVDGRPEFVMPKPFMIDAKKDPSSPHGFAWSDKVVQTVSQKGSEFEITVTADQAWLESAEREYPVVIDPTIELVPDPAAAQDTMIYEGSPTSTYGSAWNMNVGNAAAGANSYRAMLKFDIASLGLPSSTRIRSASLDVHWSQPHSGESADVAVQARRVTTDWTESTATWSSLNTSYLTSSLTYNMDQIHDEDESRVQMAGPWLYYPNYTNSINGGLHYLPVGSTSDTFTWTPTITDPGNYRVDAYYTVYPNRGAPSYGVTDATGATTTYTVDQTSGTSGAGVWKVLGTQPFEPGKPASITMTRVTASSSPVADAVRLVEVGQQVKGATQRDAWHSFAMGYDVQQWVSGAAANYGVTLMAASETAGSGGPAYEASENAFGGETANRPRLVIQYDEPSVTLAMPTKINATGAELSWSDYNDPTAADGDDLVEFQVWRGCVTLPTTNCTTPADEYFDKDKAQMVAIVPKEVFTYTDTSAVPSSSTGAASYRYWVIAKTKAGKLVPSASQLVQTPRAGRVKRILTGDIADTTIANATAYQSTNIPTPDGYHRIMPGNNHTTYGDTRALLDFDTSVIPQGVVVLDSELQLWKSTAPGSGATYDLHELTRDFVESEATWNNATSTIPWTTKGGDYAATALASLTTGGQPARLTWKTAALTDAVQKWVTKFDDNHGLLLKTHDEALSQQRMSLGAGEFGDPDLRPKLIVEHLEATTTGTYYAPAILDRVVPNTTLSVPVTITNTTKHRWTAQRLSYRWMIGSTDHADEGDRLFTEVNDLEPGESQTVDAKIRVPINSQTGNKRQEYILELELRHETTGVWASDPASGIGIAPLRQPVIVEDPTSSEIGLEKFFTYSGENTGAGSVLAANMHAGNVVFSYDPINNPSRGAETFVRLTYDSADGTTEPAGRGWSVQTSTLNRLGRASLVFSSNKTGDYPRTVTMIDGDGTSHVFEYDDSDPDPAKWRYNRPSGVPLEIRVDTTAAPDRRWIVTRPDGTRFYFEDTGNAGGIQRYIRDRNGNETTFNYAAQVGDTRLLTSIVDPDRPTTPTLTLTYVAGTRKLHRITDISGRTLRFVYDNVDTEALKELRDGGGYNPSTDTYAGPVKVFQFAYSVDTYKRLVSVKDPRAGETKLTYYDVTPWIGRVKTLTDRRGKVTEFAYNDLGGEPDPLFETTVTSVVVEAGVTKRLDTVYTTDRYGRATTIKNAKNESTAFGWDRENNVVRMEEFNGAVTTWTYDPETGYPTSVKDPEANKNGTAGTTLKYDKLIGAPGTPTVLTEKVSPEQRRWRFAYDPANGNLKTVTDPLGVATATAGDYETTYDYDAFGQLTAVHDANGNAPTVYGEYDANGYPRIITDPLGKSTRFVYGNRGEVLSVKDANDKITTAEYDEFRRVTKATTPLDSAASTPLLQTTENRYDENDNVTTVIAPNGEKTIASYSAMDEQESSILPSNGAVGERRTTYGYDDLGRLVQETSPLGNATSTNPDDFVTRYAYDPIGQLIEKVTPFDGRSSYKTSYVYDNVGNLLKVVDPRKNDTADPNDFAATMSYDLNHRRVAVTDAAGYTTRTQYDRDGLVVAELDADGNRKAFAYDARGKLVETSVPHTPTGGKTVRRTTRYFYDQNGNRTKTENPRGVATTSVTTDFLEELVYDANNRVVQRKSPYDASDASTSYRTPASTFYQYDAVGNLVKQSEPTLATSAASAPDWSTFTWYDNGLPRSSTDPWGIATSYGYNLLGQQTTRTLTSAAGDATRSMSWDYWPDGSLKSRSDTAPAAGLEEVMVDNTDLQNVVVTGTWATATTSTSKIGRDYRTHTGAAGSMDSFKWKLRIPSTGTYQIFARCPAGASTAPTATYTITHSAGTSTKTVDQSACSASSPWLALGSYSFAEGVDKTVTLAVPAVGTVVADAVKLVKVGSGPGATKDFGYGYDLNGQMTSIQDRTAGAAVDTYEIRYDGLGRADQVRELKSGTSRITTVYGYDPVGNLTSWFADDQVAPETDQYSKYTYDVRDMPATVETGKSPSDPASALKKTTYTYTPRGERATETKANGNKVVYRYMEDGLLRSQIETRIDTANNVSKLIASHSLAYSLDGHRTQDVSKVQNADSLGSYLNQTATMAYTPSNLLREVRKSGVNAGDTETYSYDPAGNVIRQQMFKASGTVTTVRSYDRNRLLCAGASDADPCGVAGAAHFNYDPFGRLNTVTVGDKVVERYGYDGFDRVVSHKKYDPATGAVKSAQTSVFDPLDRTVSETTQAGTNPAKTTTFGYLGLSEQVISEEQPGSDGQQKSVASYTYGPSGERLSQTKTPLAGGTPETSYYGLNPHTDVEMLTSESGDARATYRYTAYGDNDPAGFTGKDKASATGGPEVEPYNPYRFNSKRWDPATGGYDMGFRDYSPGLNRFLTRDMYNGALSDLRLGMDPWTGNRYAFAGGNPITGIEHDGHYAIDENGEKVDTQPTTNSSTESTPVTVSNRVDQLINESLGLEPEASQEQQAIRTSQLGISPGLVGMNLAADEADRVGIFDGMQLIADVSGVTDAEMCISEFEKTACAWTAAALTPLKVGKLGKLGSITASKGGSRLAEASAVAFRAADNPDSIFIKNKHLASAGGRQAKFMSDDISEVQGWVAQGLRSDGVQFLPNQLDGTFRAIVPAGRVVGTRGQANIRVVVSEDGRVINAFPVMVR